MSARVNIPISLFASFYHLKKDEAVFCTDEIVLLQRPLHWAELRASEKQHRSKS